MNFTDATDRPPFLLKDARLQQVFTRTPERCASVDEYARAAGLQVADVLEILTPALAEGILALDSVGGTLLIHTAPNGRPTVSTRPQAKPNLWELLRERAGLERAHGLWQLIRGLEAGGWSVELDQELLELHAGVPRQYLQLGVWLRDVLVPLVPYPAQPEIPAILDVYAAAEGPGVALTCRNRELDAAVTGARAWYLRQGSPPELTVFVLEAPGFGATVLRASDNSVTPVVVQRWEA